MPKTKANRASRKPKRRATVASVQKQAGPIGDPSFWMSWRTRFGELGISNPFGENPWVYGCTNAIGKNLRGVPFKIIQDEEAVRTELPNISARLRIAKQGLWHRLVRRNHQELPASKWAPLIARPNPLMSWSALIYATIVYLYNFHPPGHKGGEAFWVKIGKDGRLKSGEVPAELWVYPPEWFAPIIDKDLRLLTGWEMHEPGSAPVTFSKDEIVHFSFFDPEQPLRGMSPFWPAQAALRQDLKAGSFNEQFFDAGADPGGVLMYPQNVEMTPTQVAEVRQQWEDRHKGSNKKRRLAILTEGATYESSSISHKDMDFIEQLRWDRAVYLAVSGVPEAELSIYENLIESNALSQDRGFWGKTLIPVGNILEETLATQLFTGPETGIFDFGAVKALQQLMAEMLQPAESLFRLGWGINDINSRLDLAMPDVPWGEVGYASMGLVPYTELAPPGPGALAGPLPSLSPPLPPSLAPPKLPGGSRPQLPDLGGPDAELAPALPMLSLRDTLHEAPGIIVVRGDRGLARWRRLEQNVFRTHEKQYSSRMKRLFYDLRKEQLRRVEQVAAGEPVGRALGSGDVDRVLFDLDKWRGIMTTVMSDTYVSAIDGALTDLGDEFADATIIPPDDPRIEGVLDDKLEQLRETVPVTVREQLRNQIVNSVEAGESVSQLTDRLRVFFNFVASPSRLMVIARTEIGSVVNGTRDAVFDAIGVETVSWVTAGDENVRDDHVAFGEAEPQARGFNWLELVGAPGILEYPHDPRAPADEVVGCRCILEEA